MTAKGPLGELELCAVLENLLALPPDTLRRGNQRRFGARGEPDVVGIVGWWLEAKRVEKPSIRRWLSELVANVGAARTRSRPILAWRPNRGSWWAVLRLRDWAELVRDRESLMRENTELRRAVGLPPREQPLHEPRQVTLDEVT